MDAVTLPYSKAVGHKVIFNSRINLNNVTTLTPDIEVEYPLGVNNVGGSLPDAESVASVLEGSAILSSVDGIRKIPSAEFLKRVVLDLGLFTIGVEVSAPGGLSSGDIVSKPQDTIVAGIVGYGPVVGIGVTPNTVT